MKFGKKSIGAITAGLSLVMALAPAVPAFAATTDTGVKVTKNLMLNEGSTVDATFSFTATPVQLHVQGEGTSEEKTAPESEVPAITIDNIQFKDGETPGKNTKTTAIKLADGASYPHAGVYAWRIHETTGNQTGVQYNTESNAYTLIANVVNGNNGLTATYVVVKNDTTTSITNQDKAGNEKVISSGYTTDLIADSTDSSKSVLAVTFQDLKTATTEDGATVALDKDTKINVYYSAKLDPSKPYKIAGEHNDNTVYLTYSNNPGTESHGNTTPATVRDYTYQLQVTKIGNAEEDNKLAGAKFTIQATTPDDTASTGKYVQQNGTLGTTAYEFETSSDGTFSVQGLDAGTYTVKETAAPSGYNTIQDFTFTITPVFNNEKTELEKIAAEEDSTNVAITGVETASDSTVQTISLVVSDKAGGTLPLTGQAGVTLTWVAGGVVLAFGITHLVRSRKRDENSAE